MSFWDKVKDFVGIEDNYYEEEEYYDDYEDSENYDEENVDNISDDYSNSNYEKEEGSNRSSTAASSLNKTKTRATTSSSIRNRAGSRGSYGAKSDMQVTIQEPLTYEDGKTVLDNILDGKTVVLNLEMLEMDKKTQIFYFVSGGLYAVNGSISNVTKDIYVLVPEGVEIDGNLSKTVADKTLYQV